jgi:hypothetical protein
VIFGKREVFETTEDTENTEAVSRKAFVFSGKYPPVVLSVFSVPSVVNKEFSKST